MTNDLIDRLASALARIIDDHLVVQLLMARDPEAWAEAVEVLSEAEGYGQEHDDELDELTQRPREPFTPH
jgi:hypothetical protein